MPKRRSQTYEDMTPTWVQILPVMMAVLERHDGDEYEGEDLHKAKQNIRAEFARMAQAADNWNTVCKENKLKDDPLYKETGGRAGRLR